MKYPDGHEFSQVLSFIKAKLYKLKVKKSLVKE